MKVLFSARMARFDLLRAVQGLAARVTKWSAECDKALHRLICYINSTLDHKQRAFIGDKVSECRLWLFADADHAGEYDNRSTSGCLLVLVGPNTYFPLTAFSKKQTAVAMSSTESEVVGPRLIDGRGFWGVLGVFGWFWRADNVLGCPPYKIFSWTCCYAIHSSLAWGVLVVWVFRGG